MILRVQKGRSARGPGLHDVFHGDALGLREAEGHPGGHDSHPEGEEVEHTKLHGAHHLVEELADDEAGDEVDEDCAAHAGCAGLVGVDLRRHLRNTMR